jgi:NAD(P)-dependent dehydrogenase (short-subunit alcohol dehydrogenase family)
MIITEFKDKTTIVTGATSGIGRATALKFSAEGANVAAIGRNENSLAELKNEIEATGGKVQTIRADVTSEADVTRLVDETMRRFGKIDVLVNAAGIIKNGSIETTEISDWDDVLNVNLRSVFLLMRAVVPELEKAAGNIVNVSSVTGLRAFPGVLAYCVSKAAIDQLTRCAALELAPKNVRVNAVNPGVVVTNIHRRAGMDEDTYQAFLEKSKQTHPIGRPGTAEEVADLILYLASDKSAWITGATVSIDGGRAQTCAR